MNDYMPDIIEEPTILTMDMGEGISKKIIWVEVTGDEYEICAEFSEGDNFWGNSKPGVRGQGLGRTADDPFKPARTGLLGEMAFAKVFRRPINLTFMEYGDRQDFKILDGKTVDVKCAMHNYGKCLVLCEGEHGGIIPLNKDIYVNSYTRMDDRKRLSVKISLIGYMELDEVEKAPRRQGIRGEGHMNREILHTQVHSITDLMELSMRWDAGERF